MTTITKDIAAKLAVALVAVAMVFAAFAPAAQAQTTEELQAMINDLLAQVAALQGGGDSVAAGVCPYTWTRDLSQGSTGADVMKLQQFLNADPDTRVAAAGQVGSAGMETDYYGPATAAAVSNFQVKNRDAVLSPGGLVNPTGYFGPSSRAEANSQCVSAPVVDDGDDMDDDMMDDDDDDDTSGPRTLSGEASLDNFEIDGAEDDEIEEGAEDAPIAELTFEFTDGDAELSRIDMQVIPDGGNNGDDDPWDVFETFQLWVDGDMVAEENADDEDDYLDEDAGTFRFSGLDLFGEEDEELEIIVAATLQNSLEGVGSGDDEIWTVEVNAIRFFDADGVATTEDSGEDFGSTESFTIEAEGADDELSVRTNSSDPDATTLPVEDDSDSDWYTVFIFDLDTEDSDNDIELDGLVLNVLTAEVTTPADAGYDDLVDDVELVIDGVTIDDVTVGGTSTTSGTATLDFDIDGDVVIDAGDRVQAELMLKFNALPVAEEGATVQASIASLDAGISGGGNVDADGGDDLGDSQVSGSATGEVHTLRTEGLILTVTDITATEGSKDVSGTELDFGTYVFEFDVTAFEEDFYTDEDADVINYRVVVDGVDAPAASSTATLSIKDADDATTADEKLSDGQAVEYTFTVETKTSVSGSVEVVIDSIDYSAADDATEELNQDANPEDDWTSDPLILN